MTSNFLEQFKGKTQKIGKDGVINMIGGAQARNVVVTTNINFKPQQRASSIDASKLPSKTSNPLGKQPIQPAPKNQIAPAATKQEANLFYVANPFRLDDDEPLQQYVPPPPQLKAPRTNKNSRAQETEQQPRGVPTPVNTKDTKQSTRATNIRGSSMDSSKRTTNNPNNKEWVKLGGLGANIGGEEWQQKKKKLDKMQEFAEQVKSSNAERLKEKKPDKEAEQRQAKEKNARQKAVEYAKNIPKPKRPPVAPKKQETPSITPKEESKQMARHELNELEMYQRRHQELQKLLKN